MTFMPYGIINYEHVIIFRENLELLMEVQRGKRNFFLSR